MGLNVVVGILDEIGNAEQEAHQRFVAQFEQINAALASMGLLRHIEPEEIEGGAWSCDMFGDSALHYLRRIAAHLAARRQLPPPGDENVATDPILRAYYDNPSLVAEFGHLMLHSDCEGMYVPIDCIQMIFPSEDLPIPGGMVGSSYRLREECEAIARELRLPMDLEPMSKQVISAAQRQGKGKGWKRYGVESHACLVLHHAARKSIETGAAIVFC